MNASTETDPVIIRKDPPPSDRGLSRRWGKIAANLKADPGTWYLIAENVSNSIASYLRTKHGLETRMAGNDPTKNRVAELYARYPDPEARTDETITKADPEDTTEKKA